jgi:hypothetical protein
MGAAMKDIAILLRRIVPACLAWPPLLLAAGPDCTAPDRWQTSSTLVKLEAAGLVSPTELDPSRTKTTRLASEQVTSGRFRQIHETVFVKRSGATVRVITSSLASSEECSESGVEVFIVSRHLPE